MHYTDDLIILDVTFIQGRPKEIRLALLKDINKRIAAALNLSIGTVKGYVSAIFEKLGVEDRTQAALLAAKHDAVTPPTNPQR